MKIEVDKAEWEQTIKDLHFHKSELGDSKKKNTDLSTEFETFKTTTEEKYNTRNKEFEELNAKYTETSMKNKKTILSYEGKAIGLEDSDILEISLVAEDDTESIKKKVTEKKASNDRKVEEYLKAKGISSTVLGKTDKSKGTGFVASHRKNNGDTKKKNYYDI